VEVVSVKVDEETKRRMARLRDINWSEVIRQAIRRRLDMEERLRAPIDRHRATEAARRMDEFRKRVGVSDFDSTKEIRKWRDLRWRS
jgi:predicted transcriptional regulator